MIKVATVFSGIGAIEYALKRLNIDHEIVFACDNGEIDIEEKIIDDIIKENNYTKNKEIKKVVDEQYSLSRKKNFVKKSYMENYDISEDKFYLNIKYLNGIEYNKDVDLFVGGSPCQSFSTMGYQKGLEDARGSLFYDFARLVKEIEPKVFIFENVKGLLTHDKGNTWEIISQIFNSLGYHYSFKVLNSKDYGIPQNRNRIFVVGFKSENFNKLFNFPKPKELQYTMQDFLQEKIAFSQFNHSDINGYGEKVDLKYFLSDKVTSHVMSTGTKGYYSEPKTDLAIARPLLATMHKMHRAGVDNYITINDKLRRLTPRECLRLMGFNDSFKQVVSDTQMYRQAGNSIVVDVLMEIINEIIKTGVWEE